MYVILHTIPIRLGNPEQLVSHLPTVWVQGSFSPPFPLFALEQKGITRFISSNDHWNNSPLQPHMHVWERLDLLLTVCIIIYLLRLTVQLLQICKVGENTKHLKNR